MIDSATRQPTRIALIGGTGKLGRGLACAWAGAGHVLTIGSRDETRAAAVVAALCGETGRVIASSDNAGAILASDVAVLCVPYRNQEEALMAVRDALRHRVLIHPVVPFGGRDRESAWLPPGGSAALEAKALIDPSTSLVSALHGIAAGSLGRSRGAARALRPDVLVCSEDEKSKRLVIGLVEDLGLRGLDAGALHNTIAVETMTSVLLYINHRYDVKGAGLTITGLSPVMQPSPFVNRERSQEPVEE